MTEQTHHEGQSTNGQTQDVTRSATQVAEQPELDDFGLPIRKKVVHAPEQDIESIPATTSDAPVNVEVQDVTVAEPDEPAAAVTIVEKPSSFQDTSALPATPKGDSLAVQPPAITTTQAAVEKSSSVPATEPTIENPDHSESPQKTVPRLSVDHKPSEWSHQQLAPQKEEVVAEEEDEWQTMPAYAPFDMYNDDNKLVAKEMIEEDEEVVQYNTLGGAGKGYTRVQMDEDAQSATSMDDNTAYLFPERGTNLQDEDDDLRNATDQLQNTKGILTEGQRIAYVGLVRLAMLEMVKDLEKLEKTKSAKKTIDSSIESMQMWAQGMMVRLFAHMEVETAEQLMIEQLAEHGVEPADMAPSLKQTATVRNPKRESVYSNMSSVASPRLSSYSPRSGSPERSAVGGIDSTLSLPAYSETPMSPIEEDKVLEIEDTTAKTPAELPDTRNLDIDLRWTVLCDLFLVLISTSVYDSRSRRLLEVVGGYLDVPWLDICRFEKRVTDALEMQEEASKENWNEDEHMESRKKQARNRRLMMMGLATVGGGLVIGLSAGLLAPVIGAGLAAGFTTIGVAGTSGFLAGAGGAAIVTTTGVLSGGAIAVKAAGRRTGAVKTFEYRPLHNNKRVNLIVTVSGWMTGKVDDVRLPFSTVDPIMGDIYSVLWEPDMLRSMGDTINILATEALTQGLQQVLGSTILVALMAAIQLPVVLTKLAYLIDNPWSVSVARADAAGLILADSLIDRNLGSRPVTLVGFSLGSRLIMSCLRELADKGHTDLIQNVYLFGTPTIAKKDEYLKARTAVSGRFVNGYATNDWILGYLFRATGGGVMRVAGLAPVEVHGVENINVTEWVPGHMSYRQVMPRLLREVGWAVESDEFSEIEDPDPENHEKRQRELIDEIEEARKQLQQKPEKRRFAFWKKKQAEKKSWEMYDEKSMTGSKGIDGEPIGGPGGLDEKQVLFDIDAITKEVAKLAAEGVEVKQLETTLPPMKLVVSNTNPPTTTTPKPELRSTKSYNDGIRPDPPSSKDLPPLPTQIHTPIKEDISMTFDTAYSTPDHYQMHSSPSATGVRFVSPRTSIGSFPNTSNGNLHSPTLKSPLSPTRPALEKSVTMPNAAPTLSNLGGGGTHNPLHNAWADDEDEFGGGARNEGEVSMTFE